MSMSAETSGDLGTEARPGPGTLLQLLGFAGGMVFYALHLLGGSALVPLACELGSAWPLHAATAIAVAGILASAGVAWRVRRVASGDAHADAAVRMRRQLLGTAGLALNGLAVLAVVFSELAQLMLNPCVP